MKIPECFVLTERKKSLPYRKNKRVNDFQDFCMEGAVVKYILSEEQVKELATLLRNKLKEKANKSGNCILYTAGEAVYQMVMHHIPKIAEEKD